jgi:hypothetical protein
MRTATVKTPEGKVRFNEAEKRHVREEAKTTAEIYFGSLNTKMDDMSGNISEKVSIKVVKDVTEVITPAFDKFFAMDKKTNGRISRLEIIGVIVVFVVFVALFLIGTNRISSISAGRTANHTELPHNIIGVR